MKHGVRLYFDLNCLRIGHSYVPLEEDIHIASIVRINQDTVLKPQTVNICTGKLKHNPGIQDLKTYELQNHYQTEPGVTVSNSVMTLPKNRKFTVQVVNNTHKTIKLRRGCVIATVEQVEPQSITNMAYTNSNQTPTKTPNKINLEEINSDPEHRNFVANLVLQDICCK